jgi:hypothetical protein
MAAEMEAEEARIRWQQRGKREEQRRESKCAKNAFIVEWCDARERCDLFLFSLPPNLQMTSPKTLLR